MRGVILGLIVLLASTASGQEPAPAPTAREQYEALAAEFKAATDAWDRQFSEFGQLNSPEAPKEARYRDWPGWSFAPRFVALAEANPKDGAAMDALLKVVVELGNAVGSNDIAIAPHYDRAVELLMRDHLDDDRLRPACRAVALRLSPAVEAFLRTAIAKSRNRDNRGAACVALARYLAIEAEVAEKPWFDDPEATKDPFARFIISRSDPEYFRRIRAARPKELYAEAARLYRRASEDFGDAIAWQDPTDPGRRRTVGETARSALIELRPKLGEPAAKGDDKAEATKPSR